MGVHSHWGLQFGRLAPGPRNLITDVPGVQVGHCTLDEGEARTGVTAVLPHSRNIFHQKVPAAVEVFNGFGKSVGLMQVTELGTLETPILLTNTFSVPEASAALITEALAANPEIGTTTGTVNPVVFECNDGPINDIRGRDLRSEHAEAALAAADADFSEGAVGAGRGMHSHGVKGGIGSASRRVAKYTLGVLVLSNHGHPEDLVAGGRPIGPRLAEQLGAPSEAVAEPEQGSIIIILATDAPVSDRQLRRLARRTAVGLGRTGSFMGHGSGEIALAFSTAQTIAHIPPQEPAQLRILGDEQLDPFFLAAAEATEEAVISSLLHAKADTTRNGEPVPSLADLWPSIPNI